MNNNQMREALTLALEAIEYDGFTFEDFGHRKSCELAKIKIQKALAAEPAEETPYSIGRRLAREGFGVSHIWGAVKCDADMSDCQKGYVDELAASIRPVVDE